MKKQKTLITILVLLVIGFGAWYADRYFANNNSGKVVSSGNLDKLIDKNKTNMTTTEKIVFGKSSDEQKQIFQSNVSGEKNQLFTDKDEEQKIKAWGGFATLASELLLNVGDGKLEVVKISDKQKEITMEKFGVPQALFISPDGKNVAYVSFSNAEVDYGFGLYEMTKSGENLRELFHSNQEIKNLAWNTDSSKIIFSTSSADKSEIKIADLSTDKTQNIFQTSQAIIGLSVSAKNKIIYSLADPKNLGSSEINIINLDGTENQKLYTIKDRAALYPFVSNDFAYLAYLAVEVKDNQIAKNSQGEVTLIKLGKNENKIVDTANQIFGWLQ